MAIERKLLKKLSDWDSAGLLSLEQRQKIITYEENHASTPDFLFVIAWLAATCIVLGIIALIASNWQDIPSTLKLSVYFLIFAGLAAPLHFKKTLKPVLGEVLRLGLMGYSMAGIGLIAQIYHLHSNPWRGIAFWCAITLGLALSSIGPWGPALWIPAVLFSWLTFVSEFQIFRDWSIVINIVTGGCLGIFGSFHSKRLAPLIHFRFIAFLLVVASCLMLTVYSGYTLDEKIQNRESFAFLIMAVTWAAVIWFQKSAYSFGFRMGMLIFLGMTTAQFPLHAVASSMNFNSLAFKIISCSLFIIGTLALAIAAFAQDQKKIFEALCLFVFLRLLALYTESFMSLAAKGFGLITVGLLILGGLYAWKKLKPAIYAKLEGELHAKQ